MLLFRFIIDNSLFTLQRLEMMLPSLKQDVLFVITKAWFLNPTDLKQTWKESPALGNPLQ